MKKTTSKEAKKKKNYGPTAGKFTLCSRCRKLLLRDNAVTFQGKSYHAVKCFGPALDGIVAQLRDLLGGAK